MEQGTVVGIIRDHGKPTKLVLTCGMEEAVIRITESRKVFLKDTCRIAPDHCLIESVKHVRVSDAHDTV